MLYGVMVYPVMALPPVLGAANVTVAPVSPAVTDGAVGADGYSSTVKASDAVVGRASMDETLALSLPAPTAAEAFTVRGTVIAEYVPLAATVVPE
jgi:hypothetical protein